MNQKRKRGLQRGLSDIVEKQTAPVEDKSKLSRGLIDKFTEPRTDSTSNTPATQTTQGSHPARSSAQPSIAPMRDFMKVANSIGRQAVPSGLFKGKSKQIYDFLYSKTRGAIVPAMSVQLTRRAIMKGAHVGSDKTIRENLLHLRSKNLIDWDDLEHRGEHAGNLYTVYLPEEITTLATQGTQGTEGSSGHFLPTVPTVETTQGTQGITVENASSSEDRKTSSFKTNTIDDEKAVALSDLNGIFSEATLKLTGREPNAGDRERWAELARMLVAELEIAAARTTVSSVPAFLAEHLRRRLWKIDKKQARAEGRELPDEVVASPTPAEQAKDCPDCGGSCWWYPEGPDRGVAKCKHVRLITPSTEDPASHG
jgi:hypothetical protein